MNKNSIKMMQAFNNYNSSKNELCQIYENQSQILILLSDINN